MLRVLDKDRVLQGVDNFSEKSQTMCRQWDMK